MAYQHVQTLQHANQFSFTCPIFNAPTKMAVCMRLRDRVWKGENIEVRRGCQACMASSKCPAMQAINQILNTHGENAPDNYGSVEPKEGKLHADILEVILPITVLDAHLTKHQVPQAERDLILSANDRIAQQLKSAPQGTKIATRRSTEPPSKPRRAAAPKPAPAPVSQAINNAAASGDMSAAINS